MAECKKTEQKDEYKTSPCVLCGQRFNKHMDLFNHLVNCDHDMLEKYLNRKGKSFKENLADFINDFPKSAGSRVDPSTGYFTCHPYWCSRCPDWAKNRKYYYTPKKRRCGPKRSGAPKGY